MTDQGLKELGDRFVKDLKDQFVLKRLNDTGEAMNSLSAEATNGKLIISGLARVLFLEYGRKAGTMPPVAVIRAWVQRKLNVPEDELDSVAFLIARKIQREGTNILTDRTKGLQIELVLQNLYDELSEIVINFEAQQITDGLFKTWKNGNN